MVSLTLLPKTLLLVLIITFSVTLTENLQLADGIAAAGSSMYFKLNPGESKAMQWGIINTQDYQVEVQFYATGEGKEFLVFEEFAILEPNEFRYFDFIAVVPADHKDNVEYQLVLNALDRGVPLADGETGVQVQMQMQQNPRIYIGDNPVYTAPAVEIKSEIPPPQKERAPASVMEVAPVGETLEEKLERIAQANKVDDTWEETFEEEAVPELQVDDSYIEEPIADVPAITDSATVEKVECGFIDWLLSLFGIGKC